MRRSPEAVAMVAGSRRRALAVSLVVSASLGLGGCLGTPLARDTGDVADIAGEIDADLSAFLAGGDSAGQVRAVLVYHKGQPVLERYLCADPDDYWDAQSVTQSVMSAPLSRMPGPTIRRAVLAGAASSASVSASGAGVVTGAGELCTLGAGAGAGAGGSSSTGLTGVLSARLVPAGLGDCTPGLPKVREPGCVGVAGRMLSRLRKVSSIKRSPDHCSGSGVVLANHAVRRSA